ncbi:hypothetical protein GCM10009801_23150 [Streptomyces albiaxialis]|uniref:ATP-dependent DNA helicase RecG n=1 Tax=Streptomyces albiaxialis TaxID=329523 RepID=A0ABP5HCG0_9ACTN
MRAPGATAVAAALLTAATLLTAPHTARAAPDAPARPASPGGCDPLGGGTACLLPFPNDWYTRPDPGTPTGRRLAFGRGTFPRGTLSGDTDPAAWNRLDGFSPGSTLLAHVPDVDLRASGAAPVTDIRASLDRDAPLVLLDRDTGRRMPYWAELDANAPGADRRALLVHPARNLKDGHHYAVAVRGLKDAAGRTLPVRPEFARAAGPALPHGDPLRARQRALRPVLRDLERAGVERQDLQLAWDFTVAGTRSLAGDLLTLRDDAFRGLRGRAPAHRVTKVEDFTEAEDPRIAREVHGEITVPSFLDRPGGPPGSLLHRSPGPYGRPRQLPGNTQTASFQCEIPRTAFARPSRPALYGHGLLGRRKEVAAANVKAMAAEHNYTFCATDWTGMAEEDIPTVLAALSDLGRFPAIPERSQQGLLGALFTGRALIHRDGLTTGPAFRTADGRPLVDRRAGLVYDGNSQGGILGGALLAASPDIARGVLGVPGMNYGLLLDRSAAFTRFRPVLDRAYPDKLDQQLYLALAQMVWDHGEANGYANHLTRDPLPGTRPHQVLMHVAYGDHQVPPVAAEVEARTLGARLVTPALAPGRSPDRVPYWGIRPAGKLPYRGSALVIWDSGTPTPPLSNTPPTGPAYGRDPHSDPRNAPAARRQKAAFLSTGRVVDVCDAAPCTAPPAP